MSDRVDLPIQDALKMHTGSSLLVAYGQADPAAIISAFCREMSLRLRDESRRRDVRLLHRIGLNTAATVLHKTAESLDDMEVKPRANRERTGGSTDPD